LRPGVGRINREKKTMGVGGLEFRVLSLAYGGNGLG